MTLAQSGPPDLPQAGASPVPSSSLIAFLVAFLLALIAIWMWRRIKPIDPGEAAFHAIARALRLSRGERLLIRELSAAHGKANPTALLISEHALNEAIAAAAGIEDADRVRDLAAKIRESSRNLAA